MNKIISTKEAIKLSKTLREQKKSVVLVGGCFDILHIGHVAFLEEAKKHGDSLFVLLETDETISKTKGSGRPINTYKDRAKMLSVLEMVDYVVLLTPLMTNQAYDSLIIELKPAIIALTKGDPNKTQRERQAKLIEAKVIDVVKPVQNQSTTRLIQLLNEL